MLYLKSSIKPKCDREWNLMNFKKRPRKLINLRTRKDPWQVLCGTYKRPCLFFCENIANIASSYGMSYNEIIQINLAKTEKRWGKKRQALRFFDEGFTDEEKFPKRLVFRFKEVGGKAEVAHPGKFDDWFRVGDLVTDNNHREDGYRFHDVIHISFMTFLGWSPAMRSLLKKKRKSDPKIDEVEDGARAAILEESISAIIFEFARENSWFEKTDSVPLELLRIIERITRNLEISEATFGHWEKAIIEGYKVFREVRNNNGGYLLSDLEQKSLSYSQDMFDL